MRAVDQERARARDRVAVVVEIAEQLEAAVFQGRGAVRILAVEAGDVVVDELRSRRVVADDDEARRDLDTRFLPEREGLFVVTVESFERSLQRHGDLQGIEVGGLAAALLRHVPADMLPQVAELRHVAAGDIVGYRHPWKLDYAALDRVP